MIIGAAFGPKLSGKTTLVKKLGEEYWLQENRKALVFDPNLEDWGPYFWVTDDESKFWPAVWGNTNCLIIIEEAAATINRDRTLVPAFTRIRHLGHKVLVVGHAGTDLLPTMRQQIDTIYLFRQPESAAKMWAENFSEPRLLSATTLKQYEFIRFQSYGEPARIMLDLKE